MLGHGETLLLQTNPNVQLAYLQQTVSSVDSMADDQPQRGIFPKMERTD